MRLFIFALVFALTMTQASAAPLHVRTWVYYGLNGINSQIPASYMAAHTDFVESDLGEGDHGEAFKKAGGAFAVVYTDPGFVPDCVPPFEVAPGHCKGGIGNLDPPESAWLHDARGSRIHVFLDEHAHFQEALNPASRGAQDAYRRATRDLVRQAPRLDFFFADDSGGPLRGVDGTMKTGAYWKFNQLPREITEDRTFVAGREAMFRSAARPVFVNGGGPDGLPSYNGAFVRAENVAGLVNEGCFPDGDAGLKNDERWHSSSDGLLATTALEKYAVCMLIEKATPLARLTHVASWWVTYDQRWSVIAPISGASDGFTIFPEYDIVPTEPLETAHRSVGELRTGASLYGRRFRTCYQRGSPIGECAAIVNTGTEARPLPATFSGFSRYLVLDDRSSYTGGRATWKRDPPRSVPALNALVLLR